MAGALEARLRRAVSAYLEGRITAAELDAAVAEALYTAADSSDESAEEIASAVALRLSEFWDSGWSDAELRQHLGMFAAPVIIRRRVLYSDAENSVETQASSTRTLFATASV